MITTHAEANARFGIGGQKPDELVFPKPPHSLRKPMSLPLRLAENSSRKTVGHRM
ncbi:MAG: hypothetical protein IJ057_07000 [Bacteroidales bacterium]|nr:hypothetical protein [Bacteroidales bacterium]